MHFALILLFASSTQCQIQVSSVVANNYCSICKDLWIIIIIPLITAQRFKTTSSLFPWRGVGWAGTGSTWGRQLPATGGTCPSPTGHPRQGLGAAWAAEGSCPPAAIERSLQHCRDDFQYEKSVHAPHQAPHLPAHAVQVVRGDVWDLSPDPVLPRGFWLCCRHPHSIPAVMNCWCKGKTPGDSSSRLTAPYTAPARNSAPTFSTRCIPVGAQRCAQEQGRGQV